MNLKVAALLALLALGLGLIFAAIRYHHNAMLDALPPSEEIDRHQMNYLLMQGLDLVAIRGTGSMRPYIPAGDGIVAYCEINRHASPDYLRVGDLAIITTGRGLVVHQLAGRYPNGSWITSGLYNGGYDVGSVTNDRIYGIVMKTYILK